MKEQEILCTNKISKINQNFSSNFLCISVIFIFLYQQNLAKIHIRIILLKHFAYVFTPSIDAIVHLGVHILDDA